MNQKIIISNVPILPLPSSQPAMASVAATQLLQFTQTTMIQNRPPRLACQLKSTCIYGCLSSSKLIKESFRSAATVKSSPLIEQPQTTGEALNLRQLCRSHVPDYVLRRVEEMGFVMPTEIQNEALPILFTGRDCILHAQTGSGKTLTYLLLIYSAIKLSWSAVQALIVVPTRELGIQVTKVARMLAAKPTEPGIEQKSCTVMALLDGGTLRRHKSWLKADPPEIVVATIGSLCHMLEKQMFKLDSLQVLVVDEVDFIFNSSKQVNSLRKLLTIYSSCANRQTIFASASIPQHRRFMHDCMQQKWTKRDVVHVHVNAISPMPLCLLHRFVMSNKKGKEQALLALLQSDVPESCIIFVAEQSEKSRKAGKPPSTTFLLEFLKSSYEGSLEILLLEEDMNFNSRAASLLEVRQKGGFLLVSTDIAARGIDLPQTSHIYNYDVPKTAIDYLHRAGRTGRNPFSDQKCFVTNIILSEERFVLQRYENELLFSCEEVIMETKY